MLLLRISHGSTAGEERDDQKAFFCLVFEGQVLSSLGCNSCYRAHHVLLARSVDYTLAVQSYGRALTSSMECNKFLLRLFFFLNSEAVKAVGCQEENP